MRTRLVVLIAAAAGACTLLDASSPAQAWCHYNDYNPCSGRAQYSYGYNYGYQQQPYYQQQYYAQPYHQQQYYQQPAYRQPAYYQPPAYQQPHYPQQGYAAPCCEPNWWEKLWGARNCCQGGYTQGYAQTGYADGYASTAPARSDSSWSLLSSNNQTYINNSGPLYVSRDGVVTPQAGFGPNYAYAEPAAPGVETYVQPTPRYYRKRYRAYRHGPRVVVRTVYRTRVVYARPKPRMRPHVLVPGNPSTSAGTYEVAPKKVLRP